MNNLRVIYRPHPDATAEGEIRVLAEVYGFILRAYEDKKKGAQPGTPDDAKEDQIVRADREIIP